MMELCFKELYGTEFRDADALTKHLWVDAWNAAIGSIFKHCRLIKANENGI